MKDLKERALRGGVAKLCAQAANFILRIGSLMVLARLLEPKDFGLVGMVTAVTGVFSLFKDAGLSMATVQRTTISHEEVSNLFWLNMAVGALLGCLSIAIAPILVSFYQEPRLFFVTAAVGTGFLFNAAGVQHSALLQREMRFVTLAVIETIALSISIGVGIGMALSGFGYWALVGMAVALPAASTVCLWALGTWVPGMPHGGTTIRTMVRFGGMATLNSLVVYVAYNIEKVLLGRFWGAEALGIYGRAYQLVSIPAENLNSATGGVIFAALSRLQNEPSRLKSYFLKSYALVLSLTLPVSVACALFADDIILLVLGPKWGDAVPIFRLLTPTILILALINPMYWLLVSIGLVGRSLRLALVIAPLVITAYLLGLPYGPSGVAFAYSAALTLWVVPHIAWCIHGTIISPRDLLQTVGRPLLSTMVAAGSAYIATLSYAQSLAPMIRLLLGGGILIGVYLWMLLYVMRQKEFYVELFRGLRSQPSLPRAIS
ncbi:lipopolysaccharide biosynthesis protein [Nitrospira sp. BLG_2]|uniref:lipopolysaccharide biosynthesis protein n=1 Tax=Nitrospira sp. BLG_2 TaxID=3397507 RepID=UPI003B9DA3DA